MAEKSPPNRRGRILFSILGLLLGVGVLPLVWTSYRLYTTSRESLEVSLKETQIAKAKTLASQAELYVSSVHSQIVTIARTLEVDAGRIPFAERVTRIREQKALEPYLQGDESKRLVYLSVVDTEGIGAQSGLLLQDARLQEQLREGFLRGQHGNGMISVPVVSDSLQEPVIILGEPVKQGGSVLGVVLGIASLQHIREMTTESSGASEVYVVDNRGRIVAHSDPAQPLAADFSAVPIVAEFLIGRQKTGGTVNFELPTEGGSKAMVGTFIPVTDDSGWGVVVQTEEDTAYRAAIELRNQSFRTVAIVGALAVVLGTLFAGEISRPVQKLAEGARRLAGGDYATRVSVRSRNEVGILADAFNLMGEEIQKAIEEIRRRAEENEELFMGSIRMLANAIDEKDPYTRGHSERVAYYSACVAKHLGMAPDEVGRVHLSGIIHDVGKIGIEDKILRKAAALTDEEYEIMKQHPMKGEHILDAVPLLKQKAGDGLMHHENVDGSGYPRGMKGDEIPLFGRIVSVADAFDAMTTDRPYSKAMSFEAGIARLKFLSGKKFDGACVDAFERAFLTGDVTPAKARKASVASRHFDIQALIGDAPLSAPPAVVPEPPPPTV
ncbi:MAG TPA: HD domain-containing phosphohydrolase [Vicinamibacteria bacterium]|nr:HD domain-containing phosphohydrolase [Vicinamibacteria bacterium]